ncbi:uncharacterized protein LOC130402043 [Gadus chalcogrammus]|uniref:uncharacterized protein LOC130402043 n=1 Tax=Gadus chalcogrammus TaxID=1042646 RepID=UPI0024C47CB8|nr:uncharacterized protein LOC130402043 [Gadus chalcogrammus]
MHVPCSISLRSTWILCLIGCILSLPVDKGFGSNNPSPAWSDFSSPRSTYPVGQAGSVYTYGSTPQEYIGRAPSTWSQQNSDSKADEGVYSNDGSNMDAGDSGWAKSGAMDSGSDAQYPVPEGYPEELVAPMDQELEEPEEEPVLSDVSDLEPVYHFSSGSRYQQGRQAFFLARYNPGEPMVASADALVSNSYGMGNGEGGPGDPRQPGKGDY